MRHIPGAGSEFRSILSGLARAGLVGASVLLLAITLMFVDKVGRADTQAVRPVALPQMRSHPPDAQSTTGPTPPEGVDVAGFALAGTSAVSVTIPGVPAYTWHHGSGPTAAGMVIGYWDGHGYDDLVPGTAVTQTAAVNEMIASEGPASNYTDYCEPIDDPLNLYSDLSEYPPGDEHPDECLADYMKTSQSYYNNWYGWSWFSHVGLALRHYARQMFGAGGHAGSTKDLYMSLDGSLNWDSLRAEIDAGRPFVLLVDMDGEGNMHFVTVIGYGTVDSVQYYACYNTWDQDVHWYEFAPVASGRPWGVSAGVTFKIVTLDSGVFLPLVLRNQSTR